MKHTKGPWVISKEFKAGKTSDDYCEVIKIRSIDKKQIAQLDIKSIDANLISAAPEMFSAIEKLLNEPELPEHIANYLMPIYKKVKGE